MDEKKLLNRLRRGDPYALEKLMDRYLPYVATVVWNIVRGTLQPEDAEELVSDVFLAAWTHADALETGSACTGFSISKLDWQPCWSLWDYVIFDAPIELSRIDHVEYGGCILRINDEAD